MSNRVNFLFLLFLFLLYTISTSDLYAQSTSQLDSLRQLVFQKSKDTTNLIASTYTLNQYLSAAKKSQSKEDIIHAYQQLATRYYRRGDKSNALKNYRLYVLELEELTYNKELQEKIFEKNLYENEIRALNKRIHLLEEEVAALEQVKKETYESSYLIYLGLKIILAIAALLLIGWLYNLYVKSKKAKPIIIEKDSTSNDLSTVLNTTKQALVSAETKLDLVDILVYNKISRADEYFNANKSLRKKFLIHQPKGLSSGTGLYISNHQGITVIAAFDTQNSGAAGGLLSSYLYQLLDEITKHLKIQSPSTVIEQIRTKINDLFPAGVPFTGGINIAVCAYHSQTKIMTYAATNFPLFEFSNGTVVKHNGMHHALLSDDDSSSVSMQEFTIQNGFKYYLCSSGYWNQLGGHEHRALREETFTKTIESVQNQPIVRQKVVFSKIFSDWKGGGEQSDDILLFGFEF